MGRQHASAHSQPMQLAESLEALQRFAAPRAARRARTPRSLDRNAVTPNFGKPLRNRGNRIAAIERVEALEPMNVHVDETRHHDVPAQIDTSAPVAAASTARRVAPSRHVDDPFAIDDQRAIRLHTSGQDEIGARQDDHER